MSELKADNDENVTRTELQQESDRMLVDQKIPPKIIGARKNDNDNRTHEVRNSIISGSLAGMVSVTLFHPFDVIRTKMQATTELVAKSAPSAATTSGISSKSGPITVFSHTIKNGGLRAFYTGFSSPLIAQACYKSCVFTTNRLTQSLIKDVRSNSLSSYQLTLVDHFICGASAGAVNALIFVSPVEYVRSQLIAQHTHIAEGTTHLLKYGIMKGPIDVVKATYKEKGIFGLWKGAGITLVRDSVGCGSFFLAFALGQKHLPSITGAEPSSKINTIGAGMMAGCSYWASSLPLDALKTLVQTGKANSARETFLYLLKRDGATATFKQLYNGWQLAFGRGCPSAAVTLTTYSTAYQFFSTRFA
ncbi:hypothetical protein CTEN210_16645 [Chaetoceros tenuissimus]|uniref:Mitochondrial carrier protein n=1 Tax=Chaetoceros tenuissimus TaxID=426638 RepID=A0AAD3HEG9_9STRA|nr:hypothetical protein CTEN210_16645 [Chaetoceros tenuissimus]